MSAFERLLRPSSVAVIGASADPAKTAGRPINYLQAHGFKGQIWPVNPRAATIAGLTCYASVQQLPQAPDVGLVLLGPDRAVTAVGELARRGTSAAIVLAGGFGETGEVGAARQTALKQAAGSMRLLGPNTIGLVNLVDGIMLSATAALELSTLPIGRISIVSQSGGIVGALLSRAADRGVGLARLVSTGNEADIDVAEVMEVLCDDPATDVIAAYLEGLRNPARFRRVAERARACGKPIVAYKVGRSSAGARAAISHTGALAGADRLYDALFQQTGVIRAKTFSDFIDLPAALACPRRFCGDNVAVLTSTGGAGTLVADACGLTGLSLPDPDLATAQRLAGLLDDEQTAASRNPVDVTLAGVRPEIFAASIDALVDSPSYQAVIVVVGSSALANPHIASDAIVSCQSRTDKPLVAYVNPHAPNIVNLLNRSGVPAFSTPEGCAAGLAAMRRTTTVSSSVGRPPPPLSSTPRIARRDDVPLGPLNEVEAKALFAQFGICSVRERVVAAPAEAEAAARALGGRVVLKVLSRQLAHKSDIGGVAVGVTANDAVQTAERMLAAVSKASTVTPEGIVVQEMIEDGLEMVLGVNRDPQLGLALMLGWGGVAAELIGDCAFRLLPLAGDDATDLIETLQCAPLLTGYRNQPRRDVSALAAAIIDFARMAEQLGDRLITAEINPLFVLHDGQGVRAADGVMVLDREQV